MRLMEKFAKSSTNILKLENFNYNLFENKITKIYDKIEAMGDIRADSSYMNSLKNFISKTIQVINNQNIDEDKKKEILLKEANLLEKEKNRKTTKKTKHKSHDYLSEY